MQIQTLIWAVYFAGAMASSYFFGLQGRLTYLLVVGALILLFNRQLSVALTHVASKFGMMKATIDKMPISIDLARATMDAPAMPVHAELTKAGFSDAGAWDIPPMPKIKLALMVHRSENFLAAIETASTIGAQVNIHTIYSDGRVTSYTNSKLPAPKALRPQVTYVRMPGVAPSALFAKARSERRHDGITALSVDEAPRIYERLYAESMKYRKAHGA